MNSNEGIVSARRLLEELETILKEEGETNWLQGITAAIRCLENPDLERGYHEARSIYNTMAAGKGAFSDYYIQRNDPVQQMEANWHLDEIRDQLWQLFQLAPLA